MTFLNPSALWLLLLAVPLIALYALRVRPPRVEVSTTMFWGTSENQALPAAPWYRVRDLFSLAVHLLVLALLVLALSEPQFYWRDTAPRLVVVVIDNSASMNATDIAPSRFEAAREKALGSISRLSAHDKVAVVTAGGAPGLKCRPTALRSSVRQAIADIEACEVPAQLDAAFSLAAEIPSEGQKHLVVISDQSVDEEKCIEGFDQVDRISVGGPADNVGITRFQARRSLNDPLGYQVLAEVQNFSRQPTRCRLVLALNDSVVDVVPLELAPGEKWNQVLVESASEGGRLTARLEHEDALALDNTAWSMLPTRSTRRVFLVGPDNLFLRSVLEAQPQVELHVVDDVPNDFGPKDVLVLYQQPFDALPSGKVLVIEPVSSIPQWKLGPELETAFVAEQENSPLLQHIELQGLEVRGAHQLDLNVDAEVLARSAGDDPLLFAFRDGEHQAVVLNVALEEGDLPLRTAFPILVANALSWLTDNTGEMEVVYQTGEFVDLPGRENTSGVVLRSPSGREQTQVGGQGDSVIGPLDECGIWEIQSGAHSGNQTITLEVACNLANKGESNLLRGEVGETEVASVFQAPHRPVWMYVVMAAIGLSLAEWLLYQRRWIN